MSEAPEERRLRAGVTDEIVRADPRARKTALAVVVSSAIIGSAGIGWLQPAIERWTLTSNAPLPADLRLACWIFLGLVTLMALPVIAFGVYAIRIGKRVQEEERYPPFKMKLVRDTRLLMGPAAVLVGKGQMVIGATLIACAMLLVAVCAYAVNRVLS